MSLVKQPMTGEMRNGSECVPLLLHIIKHVIYQCDKINGVVLYTSTMAGDWNIL